MYDIACTLSKHLKAREIFPMTFAFELHHIIQSQNRTDILDSAHLCLPAFHCYGHKVSCQASQVYKVNNRYLDTFRLFMVLGDAMVRSK